MLFPHFEEEASGLHVSPSSLGICLGEGVSALAILPGWRPAIVSLKPLFQFLE